jgi:RNA polymerase sigma factor (sigma-70 family)
MPIQNYDRVIRGRAYKFWRQLPKALRCRIDIEDVQQEGYLALLEAQKLYEVGGAAKFNTYFTCSLLNAFRQIVINYECQKREWTREMFVCDVGERSEFTDNLLDAKMFKPDKRMGDEIYIPSWEVPREFDATELRMIIYNIMGRLSSDAQSLMVIVLDAADGLVRFESPGYKEMTLQDAQDHLGLSYIEVVNVVKECRQELIAFL